MNSKMPKQPGQIVRRIFSRYLFDLAGELVSVVVPLLTAPYAARVLGPQNIGIKSYANSVVLTFLLFENLGIQAYGRKEVSTLCGNRAGQYQVLLELAAIRCCLFVPVLACYFVMCYFSGANARFFVALTPYLVAELFQLDWYLQGIGNYRLIALKKTVQALGGALLLFGLVKGEDSLTLYLAALSCFSLLLQVTFMLKIFVEERNKILEKLKHREWNLRRHKSAVLKYFFPSLTVSVYTVFDKAMLGMLCTQKIENGYYEYAAMFIHVLKNVFLSWHVIAGTQMNALLRDQKTELAQHMFLSFLKLAAGCAIPISFGLMIIAKPFVCLYLGENYQGTAKLLQIMAPIVCFVALSNCMAEEWVVPHGGIDTVNKITFCGAVLNVILNACLIPQYMAKGAAAASVLAEAVVFALYTLAVRKTVSFGELWQGIYKYLLAGGAMLACLAFFRPYTDGGFVGIAVCVVQGAAVYFLALLLLRDEAVRMIWDQIHRRKM